MSLLSYATHVTFVRLSGGVFPGDPSIMMDPQIAEGLALGRVQFRAGKHAAAIATWKDALRVAYETQHHAAAFVLSKNLGDATLALGDEIQVQDAIGYFDYALQLLDGCGLQEEFAFHPPLENVVKYIRRRRRRAKRIMEAPHAPPPVDTISTARYVHEDDAQANPDRCTTCDQVGSLENPIIVDQADGCLYCQSCFEAYYAEVEQEDIKPLSMASSDPVDRGDKSSDHETFPLDYDDATFGEREHHAQFDLDQVEEEDDEEVVATLIDQVMVSEAEDPVGPTPNNLVEHGPPEFPQKLKHSNGVVVGTESALSVGSVQAEIGGAQVEGQNKKLEYSIQQLKSLRRLDQPCPAELQISVVLATTSHTEAKNASRKSVKRHSQKKTWPIPKASVVWENPVNSSGLAHCGRRNQEMQGPAPIMGENDVDDARSVESYNMLMEVLQTSNIEDDEEAVMVTRMAVDPRHVKEFERILRLILKNTHTVGHVSTCVVKPARGEYTYTSIVKYASLSAMRQIFPSSENGGLDFYKLFAARDSLLVEPPTYQIEAGFGTWIESDGNTRPMRDDNDDNMVYNTIPKPCCDDSCDNPHGLNVRASFIAPTKNFQLFQPRYQRNNKKGGQKNLRCFPCCRNGRHVSSGFCGDSIRVHVAVSRITESGGIKICPISSTAPAVLAYARFLNLEGAFDPMVSGPEVFPGQTIEKYDLSQYVRDKDHPLNPLFPGILRGAAMESTLQSATFEFNAECKAWHYGWTAPRGQGLSGSDAQHVLEILFLKPMGSYLFCLERLRSDTFSIYSSRRASHATVKPEAEVYENDEEVEDERGQKRKRAMAPASPAPSTMSSYSSGSASATSSPHAGNHHQYHPHLHGQSQTHASAWSVLNRPSPSHKASNVGTAQLQHAMEEVTFKVEPMPPLSQSPSSRHDHHHHGHAHHQRPHQQRPMFVGENLDMLFQPPVPHSAMDHGYHHQNSTMGDTRMLPESGDLVDHMLFADDQHERRVVSSEELPWAELYNLFDNVPMNSPSGASDDASSNNDMDDESPVSSPTPSSDSTTCTTSSAGAAAILTYL